MNAPATIRPALPEIADQALNKWPGILARFGLQLNFSGKQTPCPLCGGRDRFRFDDKEGRGTWICNVCGAGDGIQLLMRKQGWSFATAAAEVRAIIGEVPARKPRQGIDSAKARRLCRELWIRSRPIGDDEASAYLASRDIYPPYPSALRFCAEAEVRDHPNRSTLPAMLALVSGPDGQAVNIHRTYLENGRKAAWNDPQTGLPVSPRRMMPGLVPDGSAIRLGPAGPVLGAAEGIETALRAAQRFGMPAWSTINATMLEKFAPPPGVEEFHVFGDNDAKFSGQAAAYRCAHRAAVKPDAPRVEVHIPSVAGTDWADSLGGGEADGRG
ncbi:MAG TPA: primase-helicase zinc-binding domain-containing protein [Sphingomicrobium sp.]|nr:primase-helicase zinc-binding domain-containing protein [Sphingomicrobium sp.]